MKCPLCGQPNQCTSDHSCWCMTVEVPKALLESLPASMKNTDCICQQCINDFQASQSKAVSVDAAKTDATKSDTRKTGATEA